MNDRSSTVCFVAGKSGGHIIPCLTQAYAIKKRYPAYRIIMITTSNALDRSIVSGSNSIDTHIAFRIGNVPYKKIVRYPLFAIQFIVAFIQSIFLLIKTKPQEVVTTGGYIAIPVCLAAKLLRIPIQLQLLDVLPGKALSLLALIARSITLCFEQSKQYLPAHKCVMSSYPVRFSKELLQQSNDECLKDIHLSPGYFTIFVLGGSQGSLTLNGLIKAWIIEHPELHHHIQIIHQTGDIDKHDWNGFYTSLAIPAFVFNYHHELNLCYQAADIVLCRSGAGTLFEVNFFKKPIITIPLLCSTTAHQQANAQAFAASYPESCSIIEQADSATMVKQLHVLLSVKLTAQQELITRPDATYQQARP